MVSWIFSHVYRRCPDMFPWGLFWTENLCFWTKRLEGLLYLNDKGCTCGSWRTIVFDGYIEIVIFFGGFCVQGKAFVLSFIVLYHVVVEVLACAVVHVFYCWKTLTFVHLLYSISINCYRRKIVYNPFSKKTIYRFDISKWDKNLISVENFMKLVKF